MNKIIVFVMGILLISIILVINIQTFYFNNSQNINDNIDDQCAGLIATGSVVKNNRSIFWKNRHMDGGSNKPYFYEGPVFNYYGIDITLMGKGGSLDNETLGGIVCYINSDGKLNEFALDRYGEKFFSHPDTDIIFSEYEKIPLFNEMIDLAKKIAFDLYLSRLVSLDLCMDNDGNWRLIEVNLFGQTIRFAQYAGHPFFGKYTDEIIEYCKNNPWWMTKEF